MNARFWAEAWIALAIAGPMVGLLISRMGRTAGLIWLRFEVLAMALGLMIMGWAIAGGRLHPSVLPLPAPFPGLYLSPLPMADLWCLLSGLLLMATWMLIWHSPWERRILWALGPMAGSMGFFLLAGDGLSLLLGLEFISLSSYLGLVTTRRSRKVWNAGWVLLVLSEMGGLLLLLAMALIMARHGIGIHFVTDSFPVLAREALAMSSGAKVAVMVLVLLAFGVKAGLFPVMIWMPLAEPEAPGPVAGIFSGIFTALAVMGILAVENVVHPGMAWGVLLLVLGTTGAFVAALYSIVSRHVKQILAYSTLEILGLVFAALGIWNIAQHANFSSSVGTLAWDAAMILLIMHAASKFVLFAITEKTETIAHTIDGIGGLAKEHRRLSMVAAVAVATLAAVPPLGGFVGEWLLLESVLKPLGTTGILRNIHLLFLLAGIFLAMAAAVGVGTYVRWFGFVFLGPKRRASRHNDFPRMSAIQMTGYVLALLPVLAAGPGVPWLIPWLNRQGHAIFGNNSRYVVAPLFAHPQTVPLLTHIGGTLIKAPGAPGTIFYPQGFSVSDPYVLFLMGIVLFLIVTGLRKILRRRHGHGVRTVEPWTGGTPDYTAQKSFTAEGFVHPLRLAFQGFFGLKRHRYDKGGVRFYRHTVIYRLEEQGYLPLLKAVRYVSSQIRKTQSGSTPAYLSWIVFGTVGVLMLTLFYAVR